MEFRDQVRAAADIVRVVGDYVPSLKRVGSTARYMGLCPFHTEKTPSFSVHATHQFYICFGCGAKGDVFKFIEEVERVTFFEALRLLAERNGIALPKRSDYADAQTRLRASLYRMHEIAEEMFRSLLASPSGAEARAYLDRRGVMPETAREFGIGLSDRSGQMLARRFEREGFAADQVEASGLVLRRQDGSGFFDRFRGRLMFPIHNENGKTIAFGGRALAAGEEPKYLNSSETEIYQKKFVLYNLHRAKDPVHKADRSVLVEGYMDAIGLYSAGIHEVVASCGTSLTPTHIKAIRRHSENIVVNFDPDAAGSNAAERSVQMLLEEGMRVRVLELDEDLDPDEYVRKHGVERYIELVQKAPGYFYWLADRVREKFDMKHAEGRVQGFQFLLPALQRIQDKLERVVIAQDLASYLGVEEGLVLEQFKKAASNRKDTTGPAPIEPLKGVEKLLLNALLSTAACRGEAVPRLRGLEAVREFRTGRIFEALFSLWEHQPEFSFTDLESRLEDRDKTLLTQLVLADEVGETTFSTEQAMACVRALESTERERRRSDLRAQVKAAERAGDIREAFRLAEELGRLERTGTGA